jgi:hypothetical protein
MHCMTCVHIVSCVMSNPYSRASFGVFIVGLSASTALSLPDLGFCSSRKTHSILLWLGSFLFLFSIRCCCTGESI